jgi:site-specific DNA-cytosine methylase
MDCNTVLSLFDFSGRWSSPYREKGYEVYQVDVKLGVNILDLTPDDIPASEIGVILAAPPCTDFASSGAQYWKAKDNDGRTEASMDLVTKTLELIEFYKPRVWAIENPVGRLNKLFPELGTPWYFNPCEFAGYLSDPSTEAYNKRTGLWGTFNIPVKKPVEPSLGNSPIMKLGGKSERTKELRSMTPLGFSKAFYLSNP